MPILLIVILAVVAVVVFGPQLWIRHVLATYGGERPDLPGSGAELARHLLDEAGLQVVKVEETSAGDHYDPEERAVRLLPQHHGGRSIAAVAVAAHEVSHAVQHAWGERPFAARLALVKNLHWIDRLATFILLLSPVVFLFVKAPALLVVQLGAAFALMAIRIVVHIATLPVELDASFGKALPVLANGSYLAPEDLPAARSVLRAAALTYVASALVTLLDVTRWLRILRF